MWKKYSTARQATDDNIIRRMRIACWTPKATNTHSEHVTLLAFPWNNGGTNAPNVPWLPYWFLHISDRNAKIRTLCTLCALCSLYGARDASFSYSTTNKMHLFLKLFILLKRSTYFGRSLRPSSGAQNCTYGNRHMSKSCCYLLLADASSR